jgi:hypothetical protein
MFLGPEQGFDSRHLETSLPGGQPDHSIEQPSVEVHDSGERLGRATPEGLRDKVDKVVGLFCGEFRVDGKEAVEDELLRNPDAKFVIAASHFSNLDAPAAVKALGDILDVQITAESVLFEGLAPQRAMFRAAGAESFTPLSYRKEGTGKHGVFDPKDFDGLTRLIEGRKTPWLAVHPFTKAEEMQSAKVGAVYLAHKSGAKIIPTALDYEGGSVSLEGVAELAKALLGRIKGEGRATYHVGKPIELSPLDVSVIENVFMKRAEGTPVSAEERRAFVETVRQLREQADGVARVIADMLPEERRGQYGSPELRQK